MTSPPPDSSLIIALDGPAASGKGTLARKIAEHYGLAHLDTGSLYRAVGWLVRQAGDDPADAKAAVAAVARITPEVLASPALRSAEAGRDASIVAALGAVRTALLAFQRDFARHPPGAKRGAVLDGRDIGSVVCPDARVKVFVTASAEARAHRRYLELRKTAPKEVSEAAILADLMERDARDAARKDAPMVRAAGAHLLDTTDLSIEAAFAAACAIIDDQLDRGAA